MRWDDPAVVDLGSIKEHTFINPGGQMKGGKPPAKPDEYGELSHEEVGGT